MAGGQQFKKRLPMSIKNKYHFAELNEAQIEAVKTVNGPLLVLAGAGTGKTRVLTSRLSYILQNNIAHPSQICTVTFTNKAANEMRIRVEKMIGNSVAGWWLGTFHSLAARILRSNAEQAEIEKDVLDYNSKVAQSRKLEEANFARMSGQMARMEARQAQFGYYAQAGTSLLKAFG